MHRSLFPLTPRFAGRYPTGRTPAPKTPVQQTPKDKEQETPFLTSDGFTPPATKHPKSKRPSFIEMAIEAASGSGSSTATIKADTQTSDFSIQDSQDQSFEAALQGDAAASVKDEDGVSDTPKKGRPPGGDPDLDNDPEGGNSGRGRNDPGRSPPPRPTTPPSRNKTSETTRTYDPQTKACPYRSRKLHIMGKTSKVSPNHV